MKSIIFNTQMVKAIMSGSKTQTRRVVKHLTACGDPEKKLCPYGAPGDYLWVRETWAVEGDLEDVRRKVEDAIPDRSYGPYFRADELHANAGLRWRPSIYMPRWACRTFLKIKGVRVERIQDISEEDARAEGVRGEVCLNCGFGTSPCNCFSSRPGCRTAFVDLWNSINEKRGYGWDKNPLVWVVEFSVQNDC